MKVYKYPFEIRDEVILRMPKGAEVLLIEQQQGRCCVWALVNAEAEMEDRVFYIFGTGFAIPEGLKHVGSFQQAPFVWHVFENA